MLVMTTDRHRISVQITDADQAALKALLALVPGMSGTGKSGTGKSLVVRAALRLGMAELAKDPTRVLTAEAPTLPLTPKKR